MNWYHWLSLAALLISLTSLLFHFIRLIRKGAPVDYATAAGSATAGIRYAFTGAMSPKKKESAYLHLPTYTAGLVYHAGTFLTILIFLLSFPLFQMSEPRGWDTLWLIMAILLIPSALSGAGILIKRANSGLLRKLSNPDDYVSNLLVTIFQVSTIIILLAKSGLAFNDGSKTGEIVYYLLATVLLLYIPLGKLKHLIYFFAARWHLGWFYGRRGVWR